MQLELDLFVVDGQFVEQPKNRSATYTGKVENLHTM